MALEFLWGAWAIQPRQIFSTIISWALRAFHTSASESELAHMVTCTKRQHAARQTHSMATCTFACKTTDPTQEIRWELPAVLTSCACHVYPMLHLMLLPKLVVMENAFPFAAAKRRPRSAVSSLGGRGPRHAARREPHAARVRKTIAATTRPRSVAWTAAPMHGVRASRKASSTLCEELAPCTMSIQTPLIFRRHFLERAAACSLCSFIPLCRQASTMVEVGNFCNACVTRVGCP